MPDEFITLAPMHNTLKPWKETSFVHPHDKFWRMYVNEVQKHDENRVERWKGDAEGILIFTGLFAATVATFLVNTYVSLSPDSAKETVILLTQLVAIANGTQSGGVNVPTTTFTPPASAIWVNSLWFLSLFLALLCALMATLVQQWARKYLHETKIRGPPHTVGPIHCFLSDGVERFKLDDSTLAIVTLLHTSVFLFFSGLLVFLFSTNKIVAWVVASAMIVAVTVYLLLSILPIVFRDSPYQTPLSRLFQAVCALARLPVTRHRVLVVDELDPRKATHISTWQTCTFRSRTETIKESFELDSHPEQTNSALGHVLKNVNDLHELETFCEAMPAVITPLSNARGPERATCLWNTLYLIDKEDILNRIPILLESCSQLPEIASNRRIATTLQFIKCFDAWAPEFSKLPPLAKCDDHLVTDHIRQKGLLNTICSRQTYISSSKLQLFVRHCLLAAGTHGSLGAKIARANKNDFHGCYSLLLTIFLVDGAIHLSDTSEGQSTLKALRSLWIPALDNSFQAAKQPRLSAQEWQNYSAKQVRECLEPTLAYPFQFNDVRTVAKLFLHRNHALSFQVRADYPRLAEVLSELEKILSELMGYEMISQT